VSHYVYLNSINDILHKMGLTDLLDRMVWTVCLLVAAREKKIINT
jgi:hypothetical protein